MRERTVDARERANRVVYIGPARALTAELARHGKRQKAGVRDPLLLTRRVAAGAVAFGGARA